MNRRTFTMKISQLILMMIAEGHEPVYDYMLRSTYEQQRLFKGGKSKCDGIEKLSDHQKATAADIYFFVDGHLDFGYEKTADLAEKYHKIWIEMGGKPMIEWDKGHYGG